jgi:metal-responsive CopG/Arc/MetJ family transcriptional regulator
MKNQRGAVKKATSKFLGVWLPDNVVEILDQAIVRQDSDRSKFVRTAIKEKLQREAA